MKEWIAIAAPSRGSLFVGLEAVPSSEGVETCLSFPLVSCPSDQAVSSLLLRGGNLPRMGAFYKSGSHTDMLLSVKTDAPPWTDPPTAIAANRRPRSPHSAGAPEQFPSPKQ